MGQDREKDVRCRILDFWWMLELFSPQKVPAVTRRATSPSDHQVMAWRPGQPLPWEALDPPPDFRGKRMVWRHTVYAGVYQLEATYASLGRVFGEDPDAYDARPGGESACAGMIIDQDGRLVIGSTVLSSALWAAGRTRDPGPRDPRWMYGFDTAARTFGEAVDAFEGARRDAVRSEFPPPHDAESLPELLRIAHVAAGVEAFDDLASNHVVIDSMAVSEGRADDGADVDFLNSFYLEDLSTVRSHVARGDLGPGLAAYLTGDSALRKADRIDVVAHPAAVEQHTGIERLPKGRWPADPDHSLALSQQFAVNRALNDLGPGAGLMGVNGPPGTGKTTMLRDILAGNVVERARRLATLADPTHAFTDVTHRWVEGTGHARAVRQLRPELTGFEMVVASANNAAVENVTTEIPDRTAIDAPWRNTVDYFGDIATRVLQGSSSGDGATLRAEPPIAWGLVAAPLGRKQNRSAFRSAFWFDRKDPHTSEVDKDELRGMQTRLTRWKDGKAPVTPWAEARKVFSAAEKRVDTLIHQRACAQQRLRRLTQLIDRERMLRASEISECRHLDQIQDEVAQHERVESQSRAARARSAERYDRHVAAKPGVLETIFSWGRTMREWRTSMDEISRELMVADSAHRDAASRGDRLRKATQQSRSRLASTRSDITQAHGESVRLRETCTQDEKVFGQGYPGPAWSGDRREMHAPWLDRELDTARSNLFVAALQLHEDFLANTARDMLNGLRAACDILTGNHPHDLEPEKQRAAWQLFFLTVPLISTTFASVSRMFRGIGAEGIGWLLIDEAGQASPQYAAGAIWRARRTVAVGDPLQLEPVVTIPVKAQSGIARGFHVGSTWIPPRASVQTLADRISPFGTLLDQGEHKVWVSAPLRVHRRCDDPMFTLCNDIAYNGLMVNGVHRNLNDAKAPDPFDGPSGPIIAASYWADERENISGSHLQPSQIDRLKNALDYLRTQGIPPSEVIAISPFRAVADRLRGLIPAYPGLRAGTIHTAQGREAAVVILVLGGDPDKPGAPANWAGSPNLVNVAASRAKRRLYVIGDREFWGRHPYFRELSDALR